MDQMVFIPTIICLTFKYAKTQYPPYYQNQLPAYDHYDNMGPMETMYDDYDDSSECSCACQTCEDVKPCCKNVCANCFQQSPSSIVIVPYPYPFLISTKQKDATTKAPEAPQTAPTPVSEANEKVTETVPPITISTTLSTTEQASPEVLRQNDAYINDVIAKAPQKNERNKFVLTSLRRTKPNWMPKYGIVPIPDNLAEKLMLQLRSMRVLHPHKETFKHANTLPSFDKN